MTGESPGMLSQSASSAEAWILCDEHNRIIDATPRACALVGYSRQELLSRPLADLASIFNEAPAPALLGRLAEAESIVVRTPVRRKDGSSEPLHLRLSGMSVSGRRHCLVRVAPRRRAGDRLFENEEFLRSLQAAGSAPVAVIDRGGRIVFSSPIFSEHLGKTAAELRGCVFADWVDLPSEFRTACDALQEGTPGVYDGEWGPEGRRRRMAWALSLLRESEGQTPWIFAVGRTFVPDRSAAPEGLDASLRQMAENSPDLIYRWRFRPSPGFDYANPAVFALIGRSGGGDLCQKAIHPHDRALLQKIALTGEIPDRPLLVRWIGKDGREIWTEQRLAAVRDPSGAIVALDGIARDITERRRMEKCRSAQYAIARLLSSSPPLDEAAARLLEMIDDCLEWESGHLWLLDPSTGVLRFAHGWRRPGSAESAFVAMSRGITFGPGAGLPGRVWAEGKPIGYSGADLAAHPPRGPLAAREGYQSWLGFPISRGPQVLGVMEFLGREARMPDDETTGILCSIGEQLGQYLISQRAQRRQEAQHQVTKILAESGAFRQAAPRILGALCECLGWDVGKLWLVDPEKRVIHCVEAIRKEADGTRSSGRAELPLGPGEGLAGRVWGQSKPLWIHDLAELPELNGPPTADGERLRGAFGFPIRLEQETLGVLEFYSRTTRRPDEEALAMLAAVGSQIGQFMERRRIEDENRRLQEQLERRVEERTQELARALREIESFAYTMAHDLRAPLRAMSGFSDSLVEEYAGRPFDRIGQDFAKRISFASHQMDRLIQNLLEYIRLTWVAYEPKPVPILAVVDEVVGGFGADLRLRNADLRLEVEAALVMGDREMLTRVVQCLLSNALKFVAPGVTPRVTLRSERRTSDLRLWVEDNGIGIAPQHVARIFGGFQRLDRIEQYPGTGAGLAIVKRAMERMGGRVGVESAPGQGARFWIELPQVQGKTN